MNKQILKLAIPFIISNITVPPVSSVDTALTSYNFISAEKGKIILGVNVIFLQMVYAFSFFVDGFANAAEAPTGKYFGIGNVINLKKIIKHLFIGKPRFVTCPIGIFRNAWYLAKLFIKKAILNKLIRKAV